MNRPRTRDILRTCRVLTRNKQGRVTKVEVPGSTGDIYHVIIRRHPGHVSVECFTASKYGNVMCEAALHWKVCHHARQALVLAALLTPAGTSPSYLKFYKVRPNKGSLANIGKHAIPIRIRNDNKMREWMIRRVV